MKNPLTALCKEAECAVPSLQEGVYDVSRITSSGYVWLKKESHPMGEIGPYSLSRFILLPLSQ